MTLKEFIEFIVAHINEIAPEGVTLKAEAHHIVKLNDVYEGITIIVNGEAIGANVNAEMLYETSGGDPEKALKDLASNISVLVEHASSLHASFTDRLHSYKAAKPYLFVRLCSKNLNEEYLKDIPHRTFHDDLVLTPHVEMGRTSGYGSTAVNYNMLNIYGVSEDELFRDAMENAPKILPESIVNLAETIGMPDINGDLVVTNDIQMNGAAVIAYPGVLDYLDETFGSYWIMPSSIHEVLAFPQEITQEEADRIVQSANESCVEPGEILSDHAYRREGGKWIS